MTEACDSDILNCLKINEALWGWLSSFMSSACRLQRLQKWLLFKAQKSRLCGRKRAPTLGEEALSGVHAPVAWLETQVSWSPVFSGEAGRAFSDPDFPPLKNEKETLGIQALPVFIFWLVRGLIRNSFPFALRMILFVTQAGLDLTVWARLTSNLSHPTQLQMKSKYEMPNKPTSQAQRTNERKITIPVSLDFSLIRWVLSPIRELLVTTTKECMPLWLL